MRSVKRSKRRGPARCSRDVTCRALPLENSYKTSSLRFLLVLVLDLLLPPSPSLLADPPCSNSHPSFRRLSHPRRSAATWRTIGTSAGLICLDVRLTHPVFLRGECTPKTLCCLSVHPGSHGSLSHTCLRPLRNVQRYAYTLLYDEFCNTDTKTWLTRLSFSGSIELSLGARQCAFGTVSLSQCV